MEDKNRKILVKNRSASMVVITIPNRNIRKELYPGQTIDSLTFADLEEFAGLPGGDTLLREYLLLAEKDVKDLELGEPQPEYNYGEAEIKEIMLNGSLDEFLDCLDFAPEGVIELIKVLSTSLPLTDIRKMEAIKQKTGYDVANALRHLQEEEADKNAPAENPVPQRRVNKAPAADPSKPVRRVVKK